MADEVKLKSGAVVLYRRSTVQKPVWHVRIKFANQPPVRKSTGLTEIKEAEEFALELYQELNYKVKAGHCVTAPLFAKVCDEYLAWLENEADAGRVVPSKLLDQRRAITNFIKPYFEKKLVDSIQDRDIAAYLQWRRDYWITGPGSKEEQITYQRDGKEVVSKRPVRRGTSERRLNIGNTILRQIFEFAREKGYLKKHHIPTIKNKPHKSVQRPDFSQEELGTLFATYISEKVLYDAGLTEGRQKGMMDAWELTDLYIHLMSYTGMRPGEAHSLRWCDIKDFQMEDGTMNVLLNVRGKVGAREFVPLPHARTTLKQIRERREGWAKKNGQTIDPKELVLAKPDGTPIKSFHKSFNALLKKAGLEKDNDGNKRSEYSLRHTYATNRLLFGGVPIHTLATNMGTSVAMIEKHYSHLKPQLAAMELTKMGKQII